MVGSLLLGGLSAGLNFLGARKAAKQQKRMIGMQRDMIREGRDNAITQMQPYMAPHAQVMLEQALGVRGPEDQDQFYEGFRYDPGFETSLNRGLDATMKRMSIYGDTGGNLANALSDQAQDKIYGQYRNRINQLGRLSDASRQASQVAAGFGNSAGVNQANVIGQQQPYMAQGINSAGSALMGGIKNFMANRQFNQGRQAASSGWSPSFETSNRIGFA